MSLQFNVQRLPLEQETWECKADVPITQKSGGGRRIFAGFSDLHIGSLTPDFDDLEPL